MQNIQTMDFISSGDWKIETDQSQNIWFRNSQRCIQTSNEVRKLAEIDELCGMGIISENIINNNELSLILAYNLGVQSRNIEMVFVMYLALGFSP